MKPSSIGLGLFATCYAVSAFGHHGNTEYDLQIVVRYEGIVLEQRWMNPHSLTRLATRTASGEPITLEIEGGPTAVLRTGGVTLDSIMKGDQVTAVVSPSRRFPNEAAYGHEIVTADGNVVPLTAPRLRRPQVSETAQSIFGTWVPTAEFFGEMRAWAQTWALTELGNRLREEWSPLSSTQAQCVPMSAPMLLTYPVAVTFALSGDRVVIRSDWMNAERILHLDGRPHPTPEERWPQGHSVGRWENSVLVVDSVNFPDEIWAGMPSGKNKHLVERFAVSEDGKSLRYSFELEDPEYLEQPVSGSGQLTYRPDLTVGGMECDREAASRFFREFQ
jgi:hypothetical protein